MTSLTADDRGFNIIRYVVSLENGYLLTHCRPKSESGPRKLIVFSTTTWKIAAEYKCQLFENFFLRSVFLYLRVVEMLSIDQSSRREKLETAVVHNHAMQGGGELGMC